MADEVSGDLVPGLLVERLAEDNATVRQTAVPVGTGGAVALRWRSPRGFPDHRETIRVRSTACTTDCGADDVYRLRVYETTASVPRFNNSATPGHGADPAEHHRPSLSGHADFWNAAGLRLATVPLAIPPHGALVTNTGAVLASTSRAGASP